MKYTIVFNEKQDERLTELAEKLGVTKAEAVRYSILLLSKIVRETESTDKRLQIVDPEGKEPPKEFVVGP